MANALAIITIVLLLAMCSVALWHDEQMDRACIAQGGVAVDNQCLVPEVLFYSAEYE